MVVSKIIAIYVNILLSTVEGRIRFAIIGRTGHARREHLSFNRLYILPLVKIIIRSRTPMKLFRQKVPSQSHIRR
jgi:hypothetical protein